MTNIFADKELDARLLSEGYVVIPLLDDATVLRLRKYYHNWYPDTVDAMYASAHDDDLVKRKTVSDFIKEQALSFIERDIPGIKVLGGSYIVKGNNIGATLPPHQDWNIVDENQFRSFNLWIPLVDTGEHNGGIMVLPRSHLFAFTYRGPNISSAYEQVVDSIWKHMVTLEIPAGYALLYDHRLLHASGVNHTDELRLVAVMGGIEKGANMKIYYQDNDKVLEFDCTPDFFNSTDIHKGSVGLHKSSEITWGFPRFHEMDLKSFFSKQGLEWRLSTKKESGIQKAWRGVVAFLTSLFPEKSS